MNPLFEEGRSHWSLRIGPHEIDRVRQLMVGNVVESPINYTWVVSTDDPATRRWVRTTATDFAWVHTEGNLNDPDEPVAIPDGFLMDTGFMADAMGGAEIFFNEESAMFVATSGGEYMSIDDITPDIPREWAASDVFEELAEGNEGRAIAELSGMSLLRIASQYGTERWMRGEPGPNETDVFTTLLLEDSSLRWTHHSATRSNVPMVSGSVPADITGRAKVSFNPTRLWNMVRNCPVAETVRIVVDGKNPEYVYLVAEDWGIRVTVVPEVTLRWAETIVGVAQRADFAVLSVPDHQQNHFEIENEKRKVTVQVFEGFSGLDCVRFSTVVATDVAPSLKLYEEINAMNETLREARLILQDNTILLVNDVDAPMQGDELPKALATFQWCADRCAGFGEILPLFAD